MDSPSRNPLLLDENNEPETSEDESNDGARNAGSVVGPQDDIKETYRRSPSTPTDRYNFVYIAFYILGM